MNHPVRIVVLVKFAILPAIRDEWKTAPVRIVVLVKFAILPALRDDQKPKQNAKRHVFFAN